MRRSASIKAVLVVTLLFVCLDRLTKVWAVRHAPFDDVASWGFLDFTLVHNQGAAFGLGQGKQMVFVIIAAVIMALIILWLIFGKRHSRVEVLGLGLVAAGAIGNVIDRVLYNYVIDFLDFTFIDFPVFNVADVCVTCGVVLFIIALFFLMPKEEGEK